MNHVATERKKIEGRVSLGIGNRSRLRSEIEEVKIAQAMTARMFQPFSEWT